MNKLQALFSSADHLSLIRKVILATTVLLPLFFLPFTLDVFEFNKQLVLSVSAFASILIWLAHNFKNQVLEIRKSNIYLPVFLFLVAAILSTIFSKFPAGSFWGWPLDTAGSSLTIISFVLIFFVAINAFKEEAKAVYLLFSIVLASFISSILFLWSYVQLYLQNFINNYTPIFQIFSTISSTNVLSVFLAITSVLCMSLLVISKGFIKKFLYAALVLSIASVFLINFLIAWIVLIIGTIVFLTFYMIMAKSQQDRRFAIIPMIFLAISIIFGFFNPIKSGVVYVANIDYVNYSHTLEVSKSALSESMAFGTGPGTYSYNFSKYKPDDIIKSSLWNLDLQKAPSYVLEILGTIGLFGFVSFLLIIIFALAGFVRFMKAKVREGQEYNLILYSGIFAAFISVASANVLYYSNTAINYIFWILLAVLVIVSNKEFKNYNLSEKVSVSLVNSFLIIVAIILTIIFFVKETQRYIAEVKYLNALTLSQSGKTDDAINESLRAIELFPNQPMFYMTYIQSLSSKLNSLANNKDIKEEEAILQKGNILQSAANAFRELERINPYSYAIWRQKGFFYKNLLPIQGAEDVAIQAFEKVLSLYPKNVEALTQLSLLKQYKASLLKDDNEEKKKLLAEAKDSALRAISIKEDYLPAYNQLALVYNQEGDRQKVVDTLQKALQIDPANIDIRFNLGVVYYNNKEYDKARNQFEVLVGSFPNFSNARYYLGLTLARQGETNKAIEQFKEIEKLNPDNSQIKEIIKKLEAGESIFDNQSTQGDRESPQEVQPQETQSQQTQE